MGLNNFITDVMDYEQKSIKDKLYDITKIINLKLDEDFDKNIDKAVDDLIFHENTVIEGDFSYNFSVKFIF